MENNNTNFNNPTPQFTTPQFNPQNGQGVLPNSTAVLVLGILSIVTCFCYGIIGIILGIIALVLASKANNLYKENPNAYTLASYNNLKGGKICAIVGLSLSSLYIICVVAYILLVGAVFAAMPWDMIKH